MNELHVEIDSVLGSDASIESMLKIRTAREREQFYHGMVDAIARSIEAEHEEKKSRYYRRIRSYLDENYPSDITLETASEEIGLSPSYINRILKQSEHHTFIEALNIERVRRAKEHLTSDGAQIKEVAYMVGFSSSNYFIKIFKELTGVTPGKYQRNARQESTVRVS
jgi:two-component system response regulator YesN